MVIAKCVNCGKEYELEEDENPAAYECECGADLHSKGQKNLFANMYTVVEEGLGSVSSETKKQRESFKQNQAKQKEQAEIRRKKRAEMWRNKQEKRKKKKKKNIILFIVLIAGMKSVGKPLNAQTVGGQQKQKRLRELLS